MFDGLNMKKVEEVLDVLYDFTETQKANFDVISNNLLSLKKKKVGLDTFYSLTSIIKELDALRENIISRLITSLKRGDIV